MGTEARTLVAEARADVWGTRTAWSLSPDSGFSPKTPAVTFRLTLDLRPSGDCVLEQDSGGAFFTADDWFASYDEGLDAAHASFGVSRDAWRPAPSGGEPG